MLLSFFSSTINIGAPLPTPPGARLSMRALVQTLAHWFRWAITEQLRTAHNGRRRRPETRAVSGVVRRA